MRKILVNFEKKILVTRDYEEILTSAGDKKIHAVGGTFDWIHRGHMAFLAGVGENRAGGVFLIALIPDDDSVRKYKGKDPDVNDVDRGYAIALHPYIDAVFIHSDQPPCESIKRLNVTRLWKGKDYLNVEIPEIKALRELESETGITREIYYCDHGRIYSCSVIRNRIVEAVQGALAGVV
jgi:bifunctional ADP-heptose synthase (sugar kinase/adenylyltransferase)